MTPSLALSRSADGMMSAGFLPPISMISGRGTARAALSRIRRMPDFLRSGEHDAVHARVVDELLAGGPAAAGDEVEDAGRNSRRGHHLVQRVAEQRRGRRRLEHDGVAGDQRAAGRTGGEREREVERRDHRPDAVRPQHAGVLFVGTEAAQSGAEAVVLLDLHGSSTR